MAFRTRKWIWHITERLATEMRDSYERFFSKGYISKEAFYQFGLNETIYAPYDKAAEEWQRLKQRVYSNEIVFMRGFGRDASGTHLFIAFYEKLFKNTNVLKDPTNNSAPSKLIRDLTGYSKTPNSKFESIRNYQISHVFGRTKNVLAFTAPWNIVYMPKLLDPFTGHEAKGILASEFAELFKKRSYERFEGLIEDFNQLITSDQFREASFRYLEQLKDSVDIQDADFGKFEEAVAREFEPIAIST